MSRHEVRLRVRYAETDQMGIVYHANYLIWMEVGRVEFFRNAGLRYSEFEKITGLHLAVVEASCRYLAPARYDDEVTVSTTLGESNARLVRFDYEISATATGVKLATGFTRHLFLDGEMKSRKLPESLRPIFAL